MKIFWYKLTSIDSNFWGGCRQKAYANSKLIDNNFATNQDFSTINNKFLSIITFKEKHKESKQKFELHTVPSPIHADDGQIEYISVNFHNWDIHIWSWQQFTSLITNEGGYLIKSLLARLDDHPVEDLDPNSLTTKRKPMNKRMGKRTEIDLEEIVKANMEELLTTIDFNNMKDQMDYTFNIVKQEGIEEEKLIMKEPLYDYNTSKIYRDLCIDKSESLNHFWSEDRMHGFLLKRKKGQHLTKDEIHYITQQLQRCPRIQRSCNGNIDYHVLLSEESEWKWMWTRSMKIVYRLAVEILIKLAEMESNLLKIICLHLENQKVYQWSKAILNQNWMKPILIIKY